MHNKGKGEIPYFYVDDSRILLHNKPSVTTKSVLPPLAKLLPIDMPLTADEGLLLDLCLVFLVELSKNIKSKYDFPVT